MRSGRRAFLISAGVAATGLVMAENSGVRVARAAESPVTGTPPVVVFSKYLQFLGYRDLARTCRELGLDGVDLTVRPGGHVLPENVKRDLPAAVEAVRAEGLEVPMVTTRYTAPSDEVFTVCAEASRLGIPCVRIGTHQYDEGRPLAEQLEQFTGDLRGLAGVAETTGVTMGYHNHSGPRNFGAALWDLAEAVEQVGSTRLGLNFDVGHARVEGGFYAWRLHARRAAPLTRMCAVKDFVWKRDEPDWVPLGEGIVDVVESLRILRVEGGFRGPISIHIEYKTPSKDALLEEICKTVPRLWEMIGRAGWNA
ncbi:MAG TPA: sugar phosphate isomerase/epimerase family protein [Candidatus Hydrogenedentes bacterium]|nr:sugar phosphate isomerase/epimerase family protein [Candidatus Hydrogenedentota bacterium]